MWRAIAVITAIALAACGGAKKASPPWPDVTKAALSHLQASETAIAGSLNHHAPVADTAALCKTALAVIDKEIAHASDLLYSSPGPPSSVDASGTLHQQQGAENLGIWMKQLVGTLRPSMSRCADGVLLDPNQIGIDIRSQVDCPFALNVSIKDIDLWLAGQDIPISPGPAAPGQCSAP
jgi:hypothetical protein